MNSAVFNLINEAEGQLEKMDGFMRKATRQVGRAERSAYERDDVVCREPLERAKVNADHAIKCLERYQAIIDRVLSLRPAQTKGPRLRVDNTAVNPRPTQARPAPRFDDSDGPSAA